MERLPEPGSTSLANPGGSENSSRSSTWVPYTDQRVIDETSLLSNLVLVVAAGSRVPACHVVCLASRAFHSKPNCRTRVEQ